MDFLAYLGLSGSQAGGKGDMFEVTFPEKRPLGMKVAIRAIGDDTTADAETAIIVVALPRSAEKPDVPGMVEATGMVNIGDELVAVNAQLVPSEDFAAATALIQAAPWPLTLRFRRPPPGAPLARPLTGAAAEAAWTAALRAPGPDGDARRAAAVRAVALGGGTGGELVLLSVQARAALAARNRAVIHAAQGMDAPLQRAHAAVNQRAEGAQALADELVRLPALRKEVRECTEQVLDLGDSIARVEALLADRALANQSFAERSDLAAGQGQHGLSRSKTGDDNYDSGARSSMGSSSDAVLHEGTAARAKEAVTANSAVVMPAVDSANEVAVSATAAASATVAIGGHSNNHSHENTGGDDSGSDNTNDNGSKEGIVDELGTNGGATELPLGAELSAMVGSIAKVEELLAQQQAQRRLAASRDDNNDDDDDDDDDDDGSANVDSTNSARSAPEAGISGKVDLPETITAASSLSSSVQKISDVPLPHAPPPLFGTDEEEDDDDDDNNSNSTQSAPPVPSGLGDSDSLSQVESAEVTAALAALLGPNGTADNDAGRRDTDASLGNGPADEESGLSDLI